ncbi:MAG: LrgB family protein [Clostridia bacterium]|nr:LrgB family protein [Clostridia bacterium]
MSSFLENSIFFGVFLSVFSYGIGLLLKNKFKSSIFNPLLISIAIIIGFLLIFDVDYEKYNEGAKYLSYFLTPATVCLAIPLYEKFSLLLKNAKAILIGVLSGALTSLLMVFVLGLLFNLSHESYVTLLPKSITSAIAIAVVEELGGYPPIIVTIVLITGVLGNMVAVSICKLFRITEPIAKGIAIGTSSHAMGTTKAMEIGEVEGAMSGLAIVVAGILTVLFIGVFENFI